MSPVHAFLPSLFISRVPSGFETPLTIRKSPPLALSTPTHNPAYIPPPLPTSNPAALLPVLQTRLQAYPNLSEWRRALSICFQSKDWTTYTSVLNVGIATLPPDVIPMAILVSCLVKLGREEKWEDVMVVLRNMEEKGASLIPDQRLLVSLANLAVEGRKVGVAVRLVQMVTEGGSELGKVGLSVLLKAYGRGRNGEMVKSVVEEALDGRVEVDDVLLNSALDALVRVGELDLAVGVVWKGGFSAIIDVVTCNILVKGFCNMGRVEEAFGVVERMKEGGVEGNDVTRNTLVAAFAGKGDFEKAWGLIQGGNGGRQKRIGITSIVGGLAESGRGAEARKLVGKMEGGVGDVTWAVLISGLLRDGKVEEAEEVFEEGNGGMGACRAFVGGLCGSGELELVERGARVLERLWRKEVAGRVDVGLCNLVLSGLVRVRAFAKAEKFMKKMEMEGCMPSVVSFTIMMNGYNYGRMYGKSKTMFKEISRRGIEPDRVAFGAFVTTCARSGDMETGEKVLEYMEQKGGALSPGVRSYAPLIWAYAKNWETDNVWRLYGKMKKHKVELSSSLVEFLTEYVIKLTVRVLKGERKLVDLDKLAFAGAMLLRDGREYGVDGKMLRKCRRKMLGVFMNHRARRHFRGLDYPELRSASEKIFERHGWNEIDSGWRVL